MAKIKPKSLLEGISGKLSKSDNVVFYHKFGKTYAWKNNGVHHFSDAQVANQTLFRLAVAAYMDMKSDPEKAAYLEYYRQEFAAQTKYVRLHTFIIAQMMAEMKQA